MRAMALWSTVYSLRSPAIAAVRLRSGCDSYCVELQRDSAALCKALFNQLFNRQTDRELDRGGQQQPALGPGGIA